MLWYADTEVLTYPGNIQKDMVLSEVKFPWNKYKLQTGKAMERV